MRLHFGTRLYEALEAMPAAHRKFYLSRQDRSNTKGPRCTGTSSDALVFFVLGLQEEPGTAEYPRDLGDLRACEETCDMAPDDLRRRMLPVMAKYRLALTGRDEPVPPPTTRPSGAATSRTAAND